MSIPESQLETWSHQGSVAQSSATYNTIKAVLEAADNNYAGKNYQLFLQGSYGNDTNIYAESDVDSVIKLDDCWQSDLAKLSDAEKGAYHDAYPNATYTHVHFKNDVVQALSHAYGDAVTVGSKAISIAAGGGRRKADVIAAIQFRRYYKFRSTSDQRYDEGICFYTSAGERIVNYPKQHSVNVTSKHQGTSEWFKPMVRVLKNARNKLIEQGTIVSGLAPSYYLEGLLYNVPADKYDTSYEDSFINCINWIQETDKSEFVCANEQHYLLREDSPVTWRASKCDEFIGALVKLWKDW